MTEQMTGRHGAGGSDRPAGSRTEPRPPGRRCPARGTWPPARRTATPRAAADRSQPGASAPGPNGPAPDGPAPNGPARPGRPRPRSDRSPREPRSRPRAHVASAGQGPGHRGAGAGVRARAGRRGRRVRHPGRRRPAGLRPAARLQARSGTSWSGTSRAPATRPPGTRRPPAASACAWRPAGPARRTWSRRSPTPTWTRCRWSPSPARCRRAMIGTDAFQEADISGITIPITKHNFLVTKPEDIARTIGEAFHVASTGRPGPVLVDVAKDAHAGHDRVQLAGALRPARLPPGDPAARPAGARGRPADQRVPPPGAVRRRRRDQGARRRRSCASWPS